MDLGLRGKVALVTAASKGLGRASALALAQALPRLLKIISGPDSPRNEGEVNSAGMLIKS